MVKRCFKALGVCLTMILFSVVLSACTSDKAETNENNYTNESLGFSIAMDEELFSVITFDSYQDGYDAGFAAHKWKNTVSAEFDGINAPLFYVNVYDGEFDEATVATKDVNAAYLGVANGYTYTMTFSVEGDGADLTDKTAYEQMMENYVYKLPEYVLVLGYGDALYHEGESDEACLAWIKEVDTDNALLNIDPVLMVIEGDEENIGKMQAAGIDVDFSQGYMIWNEQEESAEVALAENVKISLLDENYEFVSANIEELAKRLEQDDILISYLTENGKIVEIYEQFLLTSEE